MTRNGFRIGFVAVLQTVSPAIVAVTFLYYLVSVFDAQLAEYFNSMAVLVAILMLLLPYPARDPQQPIFPGSLPIVVSVLVRWAILLAALLAIAYVTKFSAHYSRRIVLTWAFVTPAMLVAVNLFFHEWMRRLMCNPENARRTVFAGYNEVSRTLARQLRMSSEYCMNVQGFFDDRGPDRLQPNRSDQLLGRLADLPNFVKQHNVEVIFISLPVGHLKRTTELLSQIRDTTASVYYAPDIVVYDLIQSRTGTINGIPVIAMCETPIYGFRFFAKRLTDVVLSSLALLMALPLLLAIAAAIKVTSPGPVIFSQRRYGLNGEEIIVYKFRTMHVTEDGAEITQASRHDPRITLAGRILRKYSLDELPQLINVLQGRMSLVGPRPHAVAHNEMYRKLINGYMVRHKVLPGITGLAQVNGLRGETKSLEQMEARVRCDLEYLRNWSVGLDLQILAKTALRVWNDRAAY
ncbi:MAG TPA: undecaprenyl-phosphate glucose phosphotransferase [Steroidobacteraceae bacterium]|nr:undecaprenyl-phosphate glucose phosphotransferase [Steroidobacteraceae bacterium]